MGESQEGGRERHLRTEKEDARVSAYMQRKGCVCERESEQVLPEGRQR